MAVSIRPGGPEDFEVAIDIYGVSTAARRDGRPAEDWRLAQIKVEIENPESWLLLAEDAGVPIAMATAVPSRQDHGAGELVPGLCYLGFLFVIPNRWGEGIGVLLLDAMLTEALNRGFARMHLWTHDNNDRAIAMYSHRGFVRTGRTQPSINDPDINVSEWERPL